MSVIVLTTSCFQGLYEGRDFYHTGFESIEWEPLSG